MKINAVTGTLMMILFLANMSSVTFNLTSATDELAIINVPDDYPTIQKAVDAASPGDTLMVASKTYYERITISKSNLTLLGENPSSTIIDGNGTGPIIYLSANNTIIMGFTIRNSGEDQGLFLKYAECNTITNNIFNNCHIGIKIQGKMTSYSVDNKITRNTLINNDLGINLVLYAMGNTISENIVKNSNEGIHLTTYSNDNSINGNTVTNNRHGIYLSHSKGNVITGNILAQNGCGVYLCNALSTQNIITCNAIANNEYGVYVAYPSDSNVVYLNNFIQNTNQVYFDWATLTFTWDNGAEGNYWSDYSGNDANGDGIGETPYVINAQNQDNYPLMKPWDTAVSDVPKYIKEAIVLALAAATVIGIAIYFLKIRKSSKNYQPIQPLFSFVLPVCSRIKHSQNLPNVNGDQGAHATTVHVS